MSNHIDLRIIKTREKLREALAEMMTELPFDEITVYDLCARAKIRRATFYKHFSDKYDFLAKIVATLQDEISDKLKGIPECETPVNYYTLYVREIVRYLRENSKMSKLILTSQGFDSILAVILSGTYNTLIRDLSRDSAKGASLPAQIGATADFINGGLSNLIVKWLKEEYCTEDELIDETGKLLNKLLG